MNPLRVPSNWTGEAKAFVRQVEEEREASEARFNSKITSKVGEWKDWTPTLVWTGTPPSPVTKTARYCIIGKTLFFNVYVTSPDGNGATNLTISLPDKPKENCIATAQQGVGTTWTGPLCVLNATAQQIQFRSISACTNAVACYFRITGQYEI